MLWTGALPAVAQQQLPDQIGIRLLDTPVERVDDPRARSAIIDHLAPGTRIDRRIEVVSTVAAPVDVSLYGGNAALSDGNFVPADGGTGPADWITVEPEFVTLAPYESERVVVSVAVPDDAAPGEYYGVVWAEPPSDGENVQVANRVGIRLYLSVGTGAEPASDFTISSVTAGRAADRLPYVDAAVTNTGGRTIDVGGKLFLREGPAGLAAGPFSSSGKVALAPGDSGSLRFVLDEELPAGPWTARVEATSGLLERAVEARIVFPESAGETADPVAADEVPFHQDRGFLVPLALGLLILALFLVFLVWWLKRRREDEEEDVDEGAGQEHATAVAEE